MDNCCSSRSNVRLIFPCSGAADLGEISDRVARKLRNEGFGKMSCLAGIGARVESFIESAKTASENIAIDGCDTACSFKSLKNIKAKVDSYILTDFGLVKGKTEVSTEVVNKVADKIIKVRAKK